MKQTFKKCERLHSKKQIDELFASGNSFFQYPFKVVLNIEKRETAELPKVLISVSKRNMKKAVDRNRVKRLIREAYRKNKSQLIESHEKKGNTLIIGLLYTAKTILSYTEIEKKIILILQRLIEQDEQTAG